ncbi:MAG: SLOG family protein [Eubacteriales bacterium]|nr:SLOG family protein [Eubacteriales bacterium]
MTIKSACFTGPRASKMPYDEKCVYHEKLEQVLKEQIIKLIRVGVSEFYTGGQTGIDTLAAFLVIGIKQELGTTANLHLVLPYRNMQAGFSALQKDDFDCIEGSADTVACLNETYTPVCYRERNRYMVEKSDYLIGVADTVKPYSGTHMAINLARKKGIEIIIINPITFEIMREQK